MQLCRVSCTQEQKDCHNECQVLFNKYELARYTRNNVPIPQDLLAKAKERGYFEDKGSYKPRAVKESRLAAKRAETAKQKAQARKEAAAERRRQREANGGTSNKKPQNSNEDEPEPENELFLY